MTHRKNRDLEAELSKLSARYADQQRALELACKAGRIAEQQLKDANMDNARLRAIVTRCQTVLAKRFTEAGLCPDPDGELCDAHELEAALRGADAGGFCTKCGRPTGRADSVTACAECW